MSGPTCSLLETSPRAIFWLAVFNRMDDIPIQSFLSFRADLPGKPDARAFMLDLERVTDEERARLVEFLALRFHLTANEVSVDLDARGCPILADDVSVAIPRRLLI